MPNQDPQKVENSRAKLQAGPAPDSDKPSLWSGPRLQFWLFCVLLGLALIGMGLTQATEGGGTVYLVDRALDLCITKSNTRLVSSQKTP